MHRITEYDSFKLYMRNQPFNIDKRHYIRNDTTTQFMTGDASIKTKCII